MNARKAFINANVITMNPAAPHAQAIGISGDTLSVVGSNEEVQRWANGSATVTDLGGKTVVPGLIDSHSHISAGATLMTSANCSSVTCRTLEDVLNAVSDVAHGKALGEWVSGWGYDDTGIEEMRHLTRQDLDAVTTDHPVYITHISGHLGYLNSAGLKLLDITSETPDPPGGEIDKDENGEPTGLLLENAAFAVRKHLPTLSKAELKELFRKQVKSYNSYGLTSTHEGAIGIMGNGANFISVCRELEAEGELDIRIYANIVEAAYPDYDALGVAKGFGSRYFRIGGIKFFQDGSIQGLTGALLDDYHNKPGWRSELIYPQEVLNEKLVHHHKNGDHIVIHGNGDAAIESILQALELAQEQYPRQDARHMLIHCQMAHPDHITRMKKLGVIPSYFINHVYYWGDRHVKLFLGPERAARLEPLASSLAEGLLFSVHSDFPVTPIDPIFSMHTAVNRETRSGAILGPNECITPYAALETFTTKAAPCSFEEGNKGQSGSGQAGRSRGSVG